MARPKLGEPRSIDTVTLCVPRDHPALVGHFPGRPLVPGVLLVDAIVRKIQLTNDVGPLSLVTNAKFLRPILGDVNLSITLRCLTPGRFAYVAKSGDEVMASGTLEFGEHPAGDR